MSQNIIDGITFVDPVVAPSDGDTLNAASVVAPGVGFQALSDRTRHLVNRTGLIDGSGEHVYTNAAGVATPKTRVRIFSPMGLNSHTAQIANGGNAWYSPSGNGSLSSIVDFPRLRIDFNEILPDGAVLQGVLAIMEPGAARTAQSSLPGDNGRAWVRLKRGTPDFATPAVTTYGSDIAAVEDDGTTNVQLLTISGQSETINKSASYLWWELIGGDDAGTNRDDIHAIRIQYTDPGPQNF